MAHDDQTDRFQAVRAALDEMEKETGYRYILLIDDGDGQHITENCEPVEQLFEQLRLFSVWVIDAIIAKRGAGAAAAYANRLWRGVHSLVLERLADG